MKFVTVAVVAAGAFLAVISSASAQTCSAAFAKCSNTCMQVGGNKGECVSKYCAERKNECMRTGKFGSTRYTPAMSGLRKE